MGIAPVKTLALQIGVVVFGKGRELFDDGGVGMDRELPQPGEQHRLEPARQAVLLAYELNDKTLPVPNGAPIRLRLERQLGYKMSKYIMRIEAVERRSPISARAMAAIGKARATPGMPASERQ